MSYRENRRTVGFSASTEEFARLERLATLRGKTPGEFARDATRRAMDDAEHASQLLATLEPAHGTA